MVGVEGVSKVWLRGSWLQLEFDTHRSCLLMLTSQSFRILDICYAFP